MKRKHGLSVLERIERYRVIKDECWETTMSPRHTYPQIKIRTKGVMIHRAAYEELVGPIPNGLSVLHRCDNPRCHRPDHLFLGTAVDNMRDMVTKGRNRRGSPKYDSQKVLALRHLAQDEIAQQLRMSQPQVSRILRAHDAARGRHTTFNKGHGRGGWPKGRKRAYPHGPMK